MSQIFVHSFVIDVTTTRGITRIRWTGDGRQLRKVIAKRVPDWSQAWAIVDSTGNVSTLYR